MAYNPRMSFSQLRLALVGLALLPLGLFAIDPEDLPPAAKHEVDFEKEIWPIFQKHCVKCHGAEKQKSGFRIDVRELALVSYIHLRAYETYSERVIRFLLVKKFVSQF